jgi:hypothetical protein
LSGDLEDVPILELHKEYHVELGTSKLLKRSLTAPLWCINEEKGKAFL